MALMALNERHTELFDAIPEAAMGLHLARVYRKQEAGIDAVVLGGRVLMIPDAEAIAKIASMIHLPWEAPAEPGEPRAARFERWLRDNLEQYSGDLEPIRVERDYWPTDPGATPPERPPYVYGHLPFGTVARENDVFYRCEPWPTSRRVDQTRCTIAPDTYAFPISELPLVPSGFAAVGRYAMPNLMPACYRWEIQPETGTPFKCGASVPLYGQAGGGVEVCFHRGANNRGPIANPVILPAL